MNEFDLVIIGSGPAGYRAGVQAARMGKSVCMIEKTPNRLGGTWIHTGTIPSKTFRESMEAVDAIQFHAGTQWVTRIMRSLSTERITSRCRKVARYEENLVRKYFDRYGIEVRQGFASLELGNEIRVVPTEGETYTLTAEKILIATGSKPRRPSNVPFDGWRVVDADEILSLEAVPEHIIIYGGGVIGCEYACIFAALGVRTTIVDGRAGIMQYVDKEVAEALMRYMKDQGIEFVLGQKMQEIKVDGPRVILKLSDDTGIDGDLLFFAAGRTPNSDRLGLDRVGIQTSERGHIVVNEHFQTSVSNIYAAGDIIGAPALAATSASQGRYCSLHMFGNKEHKFPEVYPIGVYTIPELSSVGLTEQDVQKSGQPYVVGRAYYREVARGYIRGDEHGILKLIVCQQTHKILGIHIAGHDACNLIHIGQAFMQKSGYAQDFVDMIFNYPTLAEAYRIASFNALNKLFQDGEIGDPPSPPPE